MLECQDRSLYCGIAVDVEERLKVHKAGKGSKYVKAKGAKKIVWTKECKDRSEATKLEIKIKRMTRKEKLSLIKGK